MLIRPASSCRSNTLASRVMIFGTFDVFHPGHRFFVEEAKKRTSPPNPRSLAGDGEQLSFPSCLARLPPLAGSRSAKQIPNSKFQIPNSGFIIVVARDKTVLKLKGVLRNSEDTRKKVLEKAFPWAKVVLGDENDPMKVVQKYRPALVCLGYDQVGFSKELRDQFPEIKIERMAAFQPEKYKSSKM